MAYSIEELEDGDTDDRPAPVAALAAAPTAKRTAKRGAPKEPERSVTTATRAEAQAAQLDEVPPPPLPGEDDEADQLGVTRPQLSMMHATFNEFGITNRAERLNITRSLLSLDNLGSANELTREDASTLIDMLAECQRSDDPVAALTALAAIGEPEDDDPEPDPEPAA
jgi:hypothetical protein